MSKLLSGVLGSSLLALLSPLGCSSDDATASVSASEYGAEVAAVFCGAARKCGCGGVSDNCEQDLSQSYAPPAALAAEAGLTWDGECAAKTIASARTTVDSCAPNLDGPSTCCKTYVGSVGKGQACSSVERDGRYLDNCAQGLRCSRIIGEGTCEEMCSAAREGEACDFSSSCGPGLSCGYGGTCQKDANVGESCEERDCAEGLFCSAASGGYTCQPKGTLGSACSYADECANDRKCVDGACRNPKAAGESCYSSDECESYCENGQCVASDPAVCYAI